MSAEKGWIGEPQSTKKWHCSRASYEADRRNASVAVRAEEHQHAVRQRDSRDRR